MAFSIDSLVTSACLCVLVCLLPIEGCFGVVRMRATSLLSQTFLLWFPDVKHTRLKLILSSSYIFALEYTQLHVCFYSTSILHKFHKEANLICPLLHIYRGRTRWGYYRAATVDSGSRAEHLAIFRSTWPPTVFTTCVISDKLVYMKHKF